MKVAHDGKTHVWAFMDNSGCYMIDTFLGGKTETKNSKQRDGTLIPIEFPSAKFMYNTFMGGCDQVDQMTANRKGWYAITMNIITKKWTLRLGFDAMGDLIHGNCWTIARFIDPTIKKDDHSKWLLEAANSFLLGTHEGISSTRTRSGGLLFETPQKKPRHSLDSPSNLEHRSVNVSVLLGKPRNGSSCAWCLHQKATGELTGRVRTCVKGCATCKKFLHPGQCHALYHRTLEQSPDLLKVHTRNVIRETDGRTKFGKAVRVMTTMRSK